MKKTPYRTKLYRIRKSVRGQAPAIARSTQNRLRRVVTKVLKGKPLTVHAPRVFQVAIEGHRSKFLRFIEIIDTVLSEGVDVRIDFRQTNELHPCGTLVFMSKLDVWHTLYPGKLRCNYPEDDVVEQLFQHFEVLERMGLTKRKVISSDRVRYWHLHSGHNADASPYKELTASVINRIDHPEGVLFGGCLSEAVCNAVGHAYSIESKIALPKELRRWWIFSQYQSGTLFVVIYDAGVGIPSSLMHKPAWREYFKGRNQGDHRIIASAIDSRRSSTNQPERGQGLPEMLEFSRFLHAGGLSICSRRGGFEYRAEQDRTARVQYAKPLPGTLILWAIPFRTEQNDAKDNDLNSQTIQ